MKLLQRILAPMLMAVFAVLAITTLTNSSVMAAEWMPVNVNTVMVMNPIHWVSIDTSSDNIQSINSNNSNIDVVHPYPSYYHVSKATPFSSSDTITITYSPLGVIKDDNGVNHSVKAVVTISNIQSSDNAIPPDTITCVQKYCLRFSSNFFRGVLLVYNRQLDWKIKFLDAQTNQPLDFKGSWIAINSLNSFTDDTPGSTAQDKGESAYMANCTTIEVTSNTLLEQFGTNGCGARGRLISDAENSAFVSGGGDRLGSDTFPMIAASFKSSHDEELFTIHTATWMSSMWFTYALAPIAQVQVDEPEKWIINSNGQKVKDSRRTVGDNENFQVDWIMPYLGANAITPYSQLVFTDTLNQIFDLNGSCENAVSMKLGNTNLTRGTHYTLSCNGQTITATMTSAFRNNESNYKGQTLSLFVNTKVNNKILNSGPDQAYTNTASVNGKTTPPTKTQPKPPHLVPSKTVAKKQTLVGEEINYGLKVINQKIDENTGNTGGKEITITDVIDTTILGDVKFTSEDANCTSETNPLASTMTITCKSNKVLNPIGAGSAEDNAENSINVQISAIGKKVKYGHINTIVATGGGSNCTTEKPCTNDVEHDILDAPKPPASGLILRSVVSIAVIGILTAYINNTLLGGSLLPGRKS